MRASYLLGMGWRGGGGGPPFSSFLLLRGGRAVRSARKRAFGTCPCIFSSSYPSKPNLVEGF